MRRSFFGKMPRTRELVQCFSDTENFYRNDIQADTMKAMNNTQVYPEQFQDEDVCLEGGANALIQIAEKTALEISQQFALQQPAILYFGDPLEPGGNVRKGAENVEACICRCSNLYACLNQDSIARYYYNYHKNRSAASERVIVAQGVHIFKDNGAFPSLLDDMEQYAVDVLTTAAVKEDDPSKAKTRLFDSISNCLSVAASLGVQVLIVTPVDFDTTKAQAQMIAAAFSSALEPYRGAFRRIVFAVKANIQHQCDEIGDIFREVFQHEQITARMTDGETVDLQFEVSRQKKTEVSAYDVHHQPVCFKHPDFTMWRKENAYFGKSFAVFGDDCSMISHYAPDHITPFYQGQIAEAAGVQNWTETWWGQVIDFFGGKLSCLSGAVDCCIGEIPQKVFATEAAADVVIVYQGVQDWIHGVPIESNNENGGFRADYRNLLQTLKKQYPDAEIWCCTLPRTGIAAQPQFKFPYVCGGIHISEYNLAIQEEAKRLEHQVIDFYHYPTACDTIDGLHFSAEGMKQIAMMVCRAVAPAEGASVWNCKENKHEFAELTGILNEHCSICRKCGVNQEKADDVLHELVSGTGAEKKMVQVQSLEHQVMDRGWQVVSPRNVGMQMQAPAAVVQPSSKTEKIQKDSDILNVEAEIRAAVTQTPDTAGNYYLYILNDGRKFPLDPIDPVRIGRNPGQCDLAFPNNVISRVHAVLCFKDGGWTLCDQASSNGTKLNGMKLQPKVEYPIHAGDTIDLAKAITIQVKDADALEEPENETLMLDINRR